ncbi:MAG: hypothetical protein BWY76_02885 [bacterium ADurb.Bin429]|nr:MAG: hypothetical protein BWY76_02885 [bacterium ADurb.Bin429]
MNIGEYSATLSLASGGSLALVLDASESAEQAQAEISTLVTGVLTALPARVACRLFFLGNAMPYSPGDFPLKAAGWFRENRGRGSILAPVAAVLDSQPEMPVVIIGAGPIFDLEDWADTPLLARTTLVAMGQSLQGEMAYALEIERPSPNDLFQRVHDPVATVRIGGDGFMPLGWDNAGYRLSQLAGAFQLTSERLDEFGTMLHFLAAPGGCVKAVATLASGQSRDIVLEPQLAPTERFDWQGSLTAAEMNIFQAALRHEDFACPSCGGRHRWDVLTCTEGAALLGTPVYPSLKAQPGQFALFQPGQGTVRFRVTASDVFTLELGRVVVREGQRGTMYAYQPMSARWTASGLLQPYQPVEGGGYVVLL